MLLACLGAASAQSGASANAPSAGGQASEPAIPGGQNAQPDSAPAPQPKHKFPASEATQPARVSINDGKITVEANNSDLTQILSQVANLSGIDIKGIKEGPRMFGVYGPAAPREVLTALLNGSGYNFIMIGGVSDGPPKELLLTPRAAHSAPAPQQAAAPTDADAEPDEAAEEPEPPPPPPPPPVPATVESETGNNPISGTREDQEVQRTLERLKAIHENEDNAPQAQPQQ